MWCSKMAARWKGKDGDLNASKRDFPTSNTRNEGVLRQHDVDVIEMDEQSCMDHSILAIFEDSPVTSEDKNAVEEESETLLSALTEMLDSVEDDDGTLSPFDTLPDTKLLSHAERRDNSVELSLVERLRSRSKSTDVKCAIKIEVDKEDESKRGRKSPPKMFKHQSGLSKNKKAEAEVEVFTSSSLVNLVRIMHSYCLRLHVEEEEEEGDRGRRDHTLFSQGEVWKYERPSEESDEEINVVSDDEVTVKGAEKKDEEGDGKVMKSLLSNGNSSKTPAAREKKRVSFGPVQVASFDESEEMVLNEKILKDQIVSKALENPAGLSLKQQNLTSDVNKADVCPPKGEPKAKSLSLQQYRQLRQKRQPLVETQGNNTTKWPSVPEPPKELTPIFCLHGPVQINCGPKAVQLHPDVQSNDADHVHGAQHPVYKTHHTSAPARPHPSETKPSWTHQCGSGLKRSRSESTSPASLLQSVSANINVNVHDSKRSPVKKRTTVCIDPPNPVLLPLPFTQTTSPSTEDSSSGSKAELLNRDSNPPSPRSIQEIQNESSGTSPQRQPSSMKPKPDIEILNKCTELASAVSCRPPALCQATTQIQPSSGEKTPQPQKCIKPKTTLSAGLILAPTDVPSTETLAEVPSRESPLKEPSPPLQFDCRVQSASADAGIEAADVTSLLEQFEETQAKEERVESRLDIATSPPNLQTHGNLNETALAPPVGTHQGLSSSDSALWNLPNLQTSESVAIPEALGTEIILSTEQALPARRKNPPPKAIQIIDPRPLPSKKTQANLPEFPAAHMYSYISSDHDYCGLDRSPSQGRRLSVIEDDESQVTTHVAECNSLTSTITDANTSAKSVTQHPPEEPGARSESIPPTDKLTSLPDRSATVKDCISGAEDRTPPCTLPTPPPSPPLRGRQKRRYRRRSPLSSSSSCSSSSSSSSSSSASRSPKRQKRRHKRSESSSCSSSCSRSISRSPPRRSRWSYSRSRCSRSRSRSWSESWSRSRSPPRSKSPSQRVCHRRDVYSSRESRRIRREHEIRIQKLKAIDERRVVYVGRIYKSMTHDELRERFSQFGEVECVSLHFRDKGDHYGFVTFYNTDDAFAAIDNGGKLRKADELPFEICFGGRRQFCNSDYADLDANKDVEPSPAKNRFEDLDFDSLLKQAQKGLKR